MEVTDLLDTLAQRDDDTTRINAAFSDLKFSSVAPETGQARKSLVVGDNNYALTTKGYETLLDALNIPVAYAKRCPASLLDSNVNFWLNSKGSDTFSALISGSTGKIRSFINPNYTYIPSVEVMRRVLASADSQEVSLQAPVVEDDVVKVSFTTEFATGGNVGDITGYGLSVVHSDSWHVAPRFDTFALRLACTNGMTVPVAGRKFRVSGKSEEDLFIQVEEFSQAAFEQIAALAAGFEALRSQRVENVNKLINKICQENKLPRKVREILLSTLGSASFLATLTDGNVSSMYDVANLLTWVGSHSTELSEDHRLHLQMIAGSISTTGDTRCSHCGSTVE